MKSKKSWTAALLIAFGLFLLVRPTLAQIGAPNGIEKSEINVGTEPDANVIRQIYYSNAGEKKYITSTNYTNAEPVTDGKNVAWMAQIDGTWQIFLYNISADKTIQLTNSGNNANPSINQGKVAWEGFEGGSWQVFLFDGIKTEKVTNADLALNPSLEGDYLAYAERDSSGVWTAKIYSLVSKENKDASVGRSAKKPVLSDGKILLTGKGQIENLGLTADDIFLLNLDPLSNEASENSLEAIEAELGISDDINKSTESPNESENLEIIDSFTE